MKVRASYDFEGMNIGETRSFPCKKKERDRLRNSLQAAARAKGMRVSTIIKETSIEYKLISTFIPEKKINLIKRQA